MERIRKQGSTETRYQSVPDSIASLSESGANAEHTGKSCSRLELVVRECGLMLGGMVSVFLFDGHAFWNLQNPFRFPWALGNRGGKSGTCIQELVVFLSAKAAFRPEYSRYTWQMGQRILPWSFRISFSIHLYCISPLFLQPAFEILSIFKKSVCSVHSSIDRRKYENIINFSFPRSQKRDFFY